MRSVPKLSQELAVVVVAVGTGVVVGVGLGRWLDVMSWLRRRSEEAEALTEVLEKRRRYICRGLSMSYENTAPLMMVRAGGSWMEASTGQKYLDTRNNVCHVGHTNRRVADAVGRQALRLNTNTRYLHPNVGDLAKRLVETMPKGSQLRETGVCIFVNSGSEANDSADIKVWNIYPSLDFISIFGQSCRAFSKL